MRKFASIARYTLLAISPLAFAVTMAASAAPPTDPGISPVLRKAMQRDLGLSPAQLSQYLKVERLAAMQERNLARAQGRNFGGSWIERGADGNYRLVVASTSIQPRQVPAGVEIRHARHSLASLDASKGQLDTLLAQGARTPKGIYTWAVDLPSNSVTIGIAPGAQQAAIDFVARSGADAATVRFETMDEAPTLRMAVQGGMGYLRDPGDGYLYACSVGFSVTQGGAPGYATAGHCGNAGEIVYYEPSQWTLGVKLGSFAASNFPAPGQTGPDHAWVKLDSVHTASPTVFGYGNGDVTVTGGSEAAVGAAICRSGRTSGWRCGAIEAKNVTVTYQSGETIQNLTRTTACSEGGDSGGSFITGPGQAQGVLSGGSGSCPKGKSKKPSRNARSYFQPLNPILQAYNLTLRTGA